MKSPRLLNVHRFEPASRANGPGLRAVLWVQGCSLGCPGCFNPETHAFTGGLRWTAAEAVERILAAQEQAGGALEGLTLSGGEPLLQHRVLASMLKEVRARSGLSVLVFTGFTRAEIQKMPGMEPFLNQVDVLIAGRYDASQRLARGLIGSANKEVIFLTDRYTPADLARTPEAEVIVAPDGEITLSGIDPLTW